MFETKVYKECHPFCREVIYERQKRELFIKLLHIRKAHLMCMDRKASEQGRKVRQFMQTKIKEEKGLIEELQKNIEDRNIQNIDYCYSNWLIEQYRTLLSEWTATHHFYYRTN